MRQDLPQELLDAVDEYALRLRNAMRTFRASNDPLWKRTMDGLSWFDSLPMDHLPPPLVEEIDGRFGAINAILARHAVNTLDDYRRVPEKDLVEIQDLIEGFAFDKEPYTPGQKPDLVT